MPSLKHLAGWAIATAMATVAPAWADLPALLAPQLGANSWMQPGANFAVLDRIDALGLTSLRDGVDWKQVESGPGVFDLSRPKLRGIRKLAADGRLGSLSVYPDNPLYDGGKTATSNAAIAAFARYTANLAKAFPQVPAFEIGNEFNGQSFVTGPARDLVPLDRAILQARYLAALRNQPDLAGRRLLGGATHSIAAGFIWKVLDQAPGLMDAVAIHPYTTAPEQIPAELEVLRRHPRMAGMPVEMTEFGTRDAADAPDHFWRSYCSMALAGVSRAVWYPLEDRGDGFAPVIAPDLQTTALGRAFLFAREHAAGRVVVPFRPDPFTYGCRFGDDVMVIWGTPRRLDLLRADIAAFAGDLTPATGVVSLSPRQVLLLQSKGPPLDPDTDLRLAATDLAADSFDQFIFPAATREARGDPKAGFDRFLRIDGQDRPLVTCPGQQAPHTPWHPYLCNAEASDTVLQAEGFELGGTAAHPVEIVHSHGFAKASSLTVKADYTIFAASRNGVGLTLRATGQAADRRVLTGQGSVRFGPLDLPAGATIELVVDSNGGPAGDAGKLRLHLYDTAAMQGD